MNIVKVLHYYSCLCLHNMASVEEPRKIKSRQAELEEKERDALLAIKEDLAEWLSALLGDSITASSFMDDLRSAVPLCRLAKLVQEAAASSTRDPGARALPLPRVPMKELSYDASAAGSFHKFRAMSNATHFIEWCKKVEGVHVLFESEGLVERKDERSVILCLLDVARVAEKLGITAPELVKMEREIEMMEEACEESGAGQKKSDVMPPTAKRRKRDSLDYKVSVNSDSSETVSLYHS